MTSYTVAFLSPDPVTMYLSSTDISQLSTEEDSLDWRQKERENLKNISDVPLVRGQSDCIWYKEINKKSGMIWCPNLEYAGSIRCSPCVQQVILACAHEPFTCEEEHTLLKTNSNVGSFLLVHQTTRYLLFISIYLHGQCLKMLQHLLVLISWGMILTTNLKKSE